MYQIEQELNKFQNSNELQYLKDILILFQNHCRQYEKEQNKKATPEMGSYYSYWFITKSIENRIIFLETGKETVIDIPTETQQPIVEKVNPHQIKINKLEQTLNNSNFLANAPAEAVEKLKKQIEELKNAII